METDDLVYEELVDCYQENARYKAGDIIRSIEECCDKERNLKDANLFELVAFQANYYEYNSDFSGSFYLAMFSKEGKLVYQLPFCMSRWFDCGDYMLINEVAENGVFKTNYVTLSLEECISFILAKSLVGKEEGADRVYDHGFVVKYDFEQAVGKNISVGNNDFVEWVSKADEDRIWRFSYEEFKDRVKDELKDMVAMSGKKRKSRQEQVGAKRRWVVGRTKPCDDMAKYSYIYSESESCYFWNRSFENGHDYLKLDVDLSVRGITGGCIGFWIDDRSSNVALSKENAEKLLESFERNDSVRLTVRAKHESVNYDFDFGEIDTRLFSHDNGYIVKNRVLSNASYKCYFKDEIVLPDSVPMPQGVAVIGSAAFLDCTALKSFDIPDGIVSIRDCAFIGCSSLERVRIPSSVKSIGHKLFKDCKNLKRVLVPKRFKGFNVDFGIDNDYIVYY